MQSVFEPMVLGGINVKNRFVRSATVSSLATESGYVTDALIDYYRELSEGQVGLIITGTVGIIDDDIFDLNNLRIHDDSFIDGLKDLTGVVHESGSKIIAQLGHNSSLTYKAVPKPPWAPSAVKDFSSSVESKEMSPQEIKMLIDGFAKAAKRCQDAGFDGIQVHAAHGYLLSKFLTPYYNRRTDAYGGSVENRVRILVEILDAVKAECGEDYPVFVKINSSDYIDIKEQFTEDECLEALYILEKAGYDALEISGGLAGTRVGPARTGIKTKADEAYHLDFIKGIEGQMKASIILVGGIRSLEVANEVIDTTYVDAVALSRPLVSEPQLIKRWQLESDVKAKCVSCNKCFNPSGAVCILK